MSSATEILVSRYWIFITFLNSFFISISDVFDILLFIYLFRILYLKWNWSSGNCVSGFLCICFLSLGKNLPLTYMNICFSAIHFYLRVSYLRFCWVYFTPYYVFAMIIFDLNIQSIILLIHCCQFVNRHIICRNLLKTIEFKTYVCCKRFFFSFIKTYVFGHHYPCYHVFRLCNRTRDNMDLKCNYTYRGISIYQKFINKLSVIISLYAQNYLIVEQTKNIRSAF